jgi:pimeloyl-ACP methyl ester carboxylesterase
LIANFPWHGGPWVRQGPFDRDIYGSFAANGFRVFLYDPAGGGLSGFLPHLRDYSVARFVADLEAIRQKIGVDKMNLIGHSWGSTLAASYMAKFPPTFPMWYFTRARIWQLETGEDYDYSRTDGTVSGLPNLRLLAALFLRDRNMEAGENLVPQMRRRLSYSSTSKTIRA